MLGCHCHGLCTFPKIVTHVNIARKQYFTSPGLFHVESMEWGVDSMEWGMDSILFPDGFHTFSILFSDGFHTTSIWNKFLES